MNHGVHGEKRDLKKLLFALSVLSMYSVVK
jgi:hypothetical protein